MAITSIGKYRIYLVGAITDNPNWEKEFAEAERKALDEGYIVLSPTTYPKGLTQKEYMVLSVANVFLADVIRTVNDWKDSKGTHVEIALAKAIGTQIQYRGDKS